MTVVLCQPSFEAELHLRILLSRLSSCGCRWDTVADAYRILHRLPCLTLMGFFSPIVSHASNRAAMKTHFFTQIAELCL